MQPMSFGTRRAPARPAGILTVLAAFGMSGFCSCASDGHGGGGGGGTGDPPHCTPSGTGTVSSGTIGGFSYEVVGGFTGQGDGTSLQITSTGLVTRHTRERGTETGFLDTTTFNDLVAETEAAQFPTLCAMYECTNGCNDEYLHKLSVQLDGAPYTVQSSYFATPPDRLAAVIEDLKAIATTAILH
jgi:hypothetical protein